MIVGEGLNRDEWHNVTVRIDVHGARLIARVDSHQEEVYLKGLNHDTNYGVSTNLPSVVLVGGRLYLIFIKIDKSRKEISQSIIFFRYIMNRFEFRREIAWSQIYN